MISTKCPDAAASMALFGELGALAVSTCKEKRKFIYTKNTDYATDEVYGKHHLLHEKAGQGTPAGSMACCNVPDAQKRYKIKTNFDK